MNTFMKKLTTVNGRSIVGLATCIGLTLSLCVGNAALFAVLFPDGGAAVALAFVLTTGFLTGAAHGVALGARKPALRSILYLTAGLSWTIVASIWVLLVVALASLDWPQVLTLVGLGAAAFVPVAVGVETSRAWLARRWAASSREAPASWTRPSAERSEAC